MPPHNITSTPIRRGQRRREVRIRRREHFWREEKRRERGVRRRVRERVRVCVW